MKDVVISINSFHTYGLEEEDNIEFTTDGFYMYDGDIAQMSYAETEVTGLPGTRTTLTVMPDKVIVDRRGGINSRMEFVPGGKDVFQYGTPYGTANMGIETRSIKHSMTENGGSVDIDYVVNMEHAVVTRNRFQIRVKEIGVQANG